MTPGPWTIERRQGFTIWAAGAERDIYIASVRMNPDIMTGFANAQGIAAVPDLVAALKVAVDALLDARQYLPHGKALGINGHAGAMAMTALAKAGVQP